MDVISIRIWKVVTYDNCFDNENRIPSHVEWYYQIERDGCEVGPWLTLESAKFTLARELAGENVEINEYSF